MSLNSAEIYAEILINSQSRILVFQLMSSSHRSTCSFSWNLWKHTTNGRGDCRGCSGFLPTLCDLSKAGAESKTSLPIISISMLDINATGSSPPSLSSGTFTILKLDLRERFSKSSMRSRSCVFCVCKDLIAASAVNNFSKFSPARDSVCSQAGLKVIYSLFYSVNISLQRANRILNKNGNVVS